MFHRLGDLVQNFTKSSEKSGHETSKKVNIAIFEDFLDFERKFSLEVFGRISLHSSRLRGWETNPHKPFYQLWSMKNSI